MKTMMILVSVVVSLVMFAAGSALADTWTATFESGLGQDQAAIDSLIAGLSFTTTTGGAVHYVDVSTGAYNATDGTGTIYEGGEYFVDGQVGAAVWNLPEQAKVTFTLGTAGLFKIGYSSQFSFTLQAYDATGVLLTSATGTPNTKSKGGTGLGYVQVSRAESDIAYVVFGSNYGGYWVADDVTTDAPAATPEPGAILMLGMGIVGLAARMKARRA